MSDITNHYETCEICNYDGHVCPGCGDDIPHKKDNIRGACESCSEEVKL